MADEAGAATQAPEKTETAEEKPREKVLPELAPEVMESTRLYELMVMLDPAEASRTWDKLVEWVEGLLEEKHGQHVLRVDKWADSKKLSYEVRGLKRATFMLVWFRSDTSKIPAIDRDLRLDERAVRHLINVHDEEPPNVGMTSDDMEQANPTPSKGDRDRS